MNWSRCSRTLAVALLVLTLLAPVASAVAVGPSGVPGEAQVGSDVSATFTFTELYSDYEEWTLHGETNATNVTWTVTQYDQAGNQLSQQSYDGQSFDESVALSSDASKVEVEIAGTTPEVANYSYEPPQTFRLAEFSQVREGGTSKSLERFGVHYYTEESKPARQAIDDAAPAVESSGSKQAKRKLDQAKQAYNRENFELATDLASDAKQAAQSSQQTQLLVYAAVALVVVVLVAGGIYYWWSNRSTYDKLA
ncbi:MAG: hypothetical protein ABEJ31_05990 [Haloarculaceae archaeon]